jgi:hypothetical protein
MRYNARAMFLPWPWAANQINKNVDVNQPSEIIMTSRFHILFIRTFLDWADINLA